MIGNSFVLSANQQRRPMKRAMPVKLPRESTPTRSRTYDVPYQSSSPTIRTSLRNTTDAVPLSKLPKGHSKQNHKSLNPPGPSKKRGRRAIHAVDEAVGEADEAARPDAEAEDKDHSTRTGPHGRLQLARNYVAAAKCRLKKKDEVSRLAERALEMEEENANLAQCCERLRTEVIELKSLLRQHTNCDCAMIQTYIIKKERRVAEWLAESVGGLVVGEDQSAAVVAGEREG